MQDAIIYDIKATQGSKQYEQTDNFDAEYEELQADVLKDTKTSGIITFKAMKQDKDITIYAEGYNEDDYDNFTFKFDVSVK